MLLDDEDLVYFTARPPSSTLSAHVSGIANRLVLGRFVGELEVEICSLIN